MIIDVVAGVVVITAPQLFGFVTTIGTLYTQYMIPLIIGGIVLSILGAVNPRKKLNIDTFLEKYIREKKRKKKIILEKKKWQM